MTCEFFCVETKSINVDYYYCSSLYALKRETFTQKRVRVSSFRVSARFLNPLTVEYNVNPDY